jgi:hypothetical protein
MFHFEEAEFFEIDDATRQAGPPQVSFASGPPVSFGGSSGGGGQATP